MMGPLRLSQIQESLQGSLSGDDCAFTGVSIDSRTLQPGDLYIAIPGERFDGHEFASQAALAGAVAVLGEQAMAVALPQMQVADSRIALGQLAAMNRQGFTGSLVAITGSCGKTTTKEMLAAVLGQSGNTLYTRGNLNNEIGAPLTLLRLNPETRYAVIELGASGLGEIAWTVSLAAPELALITNASEAHLEGFGSLENIVQAKGEIIDGLGPKGQVVLNRDEPAFPRWQARAGQRRVITVSTREVSAADYRAESITSTDRGQQFLCCRSDGSRTPVSLGLSGRHNVANALQVIAAAEALGIEASQWQPALAAINAAPGRLQREPLSAQVTLLDDSYNANPASMSAALATLAQEPRRRIAVLGDMAELGTESQALHQAMGAKAMALGIEHLLVCGTYAPDYRQGSQGAALLADTHEHLINQLMPLLDRPCTVLIKGSRSAAMDQLVVLLKKRITG
ncbi:MAG: UDP-N-acetylmuramoyl-tripeptide--D-alanyl-D-alanine ligase [Halomonadaceae bacterium]|nr:MAG: UDP-N-acetylmuramoyl-tripeptide--D-alanyl-D-alanine ligase [Halomonadaceae bacterium]